MPTSTPRSPSPSAPRTAVVTGASRGLGLAITDHLAAEGWRVIATARGAADLTAATAELGPAVTAIGGDVADAEHRRDVADAVGGRLDLLVNNASLLGPSPLPALAEVELDALRGVVEANVVAPLALFQLLHPALAVAGGVVINLSSDAALGAWPGWGVYGASKSALDQLTAVLAAEHPQLSVYALDPGDMRTAMHQQAFPGQDISDRPLPHTVMPAVRHLLDARPPSGRYRAVDLLQPSATTGGAAR